MAHDHFQAGDDPAPAVAAGIVAEAQERLRQHRQHADDEVVAQHRRLEAQVRRRSLIGAICAAAMLAPAVVGVRWLGLPLGALIGVLLLHGPLHRLRLGWVLLAITGVTLLAGLPFIRAEHGARLVILGVPFGLLGLAALPLALRWIAAPIPGADRPRPDGDIGLIRRFAQPAELLARSDARQAVTTVNTAMSELKHRASFIMVVVLGMALAWLLHPLGNLAVNAGHDLAGGIGTANEAARMQSLLALVGGLAAAWIVHSEMAVPLASLVYGLGVGGVQVAAIVSGLSAFTVWTSIWVWAAWIVAGGVLALIAEHRDVATPQRVT
jgi:hypothetical protein